MIIAIEILIITALILVNLLLLDRVRPVVKKTVTEVKDTVKDIVHPPTKDPEYEKWVKIMQNIDAYDGSGKGQIKI